MEILEIALKLENDGEKYYQEQAEKNKDNPLYNVFMKLSEQEKKHAEVIKKNADDLSYALEDDDIMSDVKKIFNDLNDFDVEHTKQPTQLDFYRMAMEKEVESIELYTKLLKQSDDDQSKKLYEWLIGQEENHKKILNDLVDMLFNAEEWVEHAEFGVRDEY